jgi:hypothetical protein
LIAAAGCVIAASCPAGPRVGIERLQHLEDLPLLHENVRVEQCSTFDRAGGNDDRNWWLYLDTNGEYVLFDEAGPGCVYRLWMTHSQESFTTNRIRVYFDGEPAPRLDLRVADLFGGAVAPFLAPLVGSREQSSGGLYSYVPLPYQRSCRITMTGFPPEDERPQHWPADWGYYNVTFHRLDDTNGVATWTGAEDYSGVLDQWTHLGRDPKPTNSYSTLAGATSVAAGATSVLANISGAGYIGAIRLDPEPHEPTLLRHTRLQMFWDGDASPAVDVPLGEFFGSHFGEVQAKSLMIGMRTNGMYYCYFPMPFWTQALIRVACAGAEGLSSLAYQVQYSTNAYPSARAGYFRAQRQGRVLPGDGSDYPLLSAAGRGHCVGVSLSMQASDTLVSSSGLAFLEVDERLFADGVQSPSIHGTGVEDYFNGGWYFSGGAFAKPCHGAPVWHLNGGEPSNYCQAYRLHLADALPFYNQVQFGFEASSAFMASDTWTSVAFFYQAAGHRPGLTSCAEFDVGDSTAEDAFGYHSSPPADRHVSTWFYPGGSDPAPLTDDGRHVTGYSEFAVPLPPQNAGVLLRRRMDAVPGRQRAAVFVDGMWAGVWYTPDSSWSNTSNRWRDAEFLVPRGFTSGKTNVVIRMERDPAGAPSWREYRYWVFAFLPLDSPDDTDADGLPDAWEVANFGRSGATRGDQDSDHDGADNRSEFVAGTCPTNPASWLCCDWVRRTGECRVTFASVTNRFYDVLEATDLTRAVWRPITSGVSGSGVLCEIPVAPAERTRFYRLQVRIEPPVLDFQRRFQ